MGVRRELFFTLADIAVVVDVEAAGLPVIRWGSVEGFTAVGEGLDGTSLSEPKAFLIVPLITNEGGEEVGGEMLDPEESGSWGGGL